LSYSPDGKKGKKSLTQTDGDFINVIQGRFFLFPLSSTNLYTLLKGWMSIKVKYKTCVHSSILSVKPGSGYLQNGPKVIKYGKKDNIMITNVLQSRVPIFASIGILTVLEVQ